MGGISIWQLLIIFAIVLLLFGTKRLRNLGSDLGSAIKGFRKSMQGEDEGVGSLEEDKQEDLPKSEKQNAKQGKTSEKPRKK